MSNDAEGGLAIAHRLHFMPLYTQRKHGFYVDTRRLSFFAAIK